MGIYNMYGRQLQYHCNKILSSVHNGLSTKAEGLLTKVRATTPSTEKYDLVQEWCTIMTAKD